MCESDNLRKRTLEYLRLAADCLQLARDAPSSDMQVHFLRMAEKWQALADRAVTTHSARTTDQQEEHWSPTARAATDRQVLDHAERELQQRGSYFEDDPGRSAREP